MYMTKKNVLRKSKSALCEIKSRNVVFVIVNEPYGSIFISYD